MKSLQRHTLRISQSLSKKIDIMARSEGRSKNKEIETAIKRYVSDFERRYGEIKVEFED